MKNRVFSCPRNIHQAPAAITPTVKKLSRKLTIIMPATLFIISEQNIHQFITFNFESCCYPKIPQYQRLAQICIGHNYQVLRSAVLLAVWRTVRLPSEMGAGLHVAGVYSHFTVSAYAHFTVRLLHDDNGCRPFTVVNTSDYTQIIETMYLLVDSFHATDWH